MNTEHKTYPYGYSSVRNQINLTPNSYTTTILTLGNVKSNTVQFYNRPVLNAFNTPEKALDIFLNYKLEYGAKFIFGGEHFLVNGNIITDRSLNIVVYIKDGVIHYNTDVEYKRGLKTLLDEILKTPNTGIKPMITPHINKFFYKELPSYKFKSLKEMKDKYREIGRGFIEANKTLFKKV